MHRFNIIHWSLAAAIVSLSSISMNSHAAAPDCADAKILCVGPGQEYDTSSVTHVENVFNAAFNAAKPGDQIRIHGGDYYHRLNADSVNFLIMSTSGTASAPITIEPFTGEKVHFHGFGFPEGTSGPSRTSEVLFRVTGDYVHMKNIELSYSSRYGLVIEGSFGVYENLKVHDSWLNNILIGAGDKRVEGNIIRLSEVYRSRHHSGILIGPTGLTYTDYTIGNIVEDTLSYHNGFEPDGDKVPGGAKGTGDPEGGGNSDGIESFKACHDSAQSVSGVDNFCPQNIVRGSIVWGNADDGMDHTFGDGSVIENNIAFNNGPEGERGFKGLRYVKGGISYVGNIAISNDARGFEPRMEKQGILYHNLSHHHDSNGFSIGFDSPSSSLAKVYNNVSVSNQGEDFSISPGVESRTNWSGSSQGLAQFLNRNFIGDVVGFESTAIWENWPVKIKLDYIRAQFRYAFMMKAGSPLIDAGTFIPGFHCDRADDAASNPMPVDADCRHWKGSAPDIGPYEYEVLSDPRPNPPALIKVE